MPTLVPAARLDINQSQVLKNAIINGDMRVVQRGTSFSVASAYTIYTLDRWLFGQSSDAGAITVSQDSSVVPDSKTGYSLKITNAAGNDPVIGAGQLAFLIHRVEGYNIRSFVGENLTLSFWARSSKVGTYYVSFTNVVDRSYVSPFVVSAPNVWQRYTITLPMNYSGGTWNYTNGIGLAIGFSLAMGSTWQTSTFNQWQSTITLAGTDQVNWLNETSNTFYITGVQLEAGSEATPFQSRSFGDELRLCQRYYEVSGGRLDSTNGRIQFAVPSNTIAANQPIGFVSFKVSKRTYNPVNTVYDLGGTSGRLANGSGVSLGANTGADWQPTVGNADGFMIYCSAGATTNQLACLGMFTSDAEL